MQKYKIQLLKDWKFSDERIFIKAGTVLVVGEMNKNYWFMNAKENWLVINDKYPSSGDLPSVIPKSEARQMFINVTTIDEYGGDVVKWKNDYDKLNSEMNSEKILI